LKKQTNPAFELIVVDQSNGDDVERLVRELQLAGGVHHIRSDRGLSLGRNVGLRHAKGDIVGFPDDDCWYDEYVTELVKLFFRQPGSAVLTGRTVDSEGAESVSAHRAESGAINRGNVFESGNSNTLFARMAVVRRVGGFDESLGVGAATPFQSGEETDFLLRCLERGYQLFYDRDFTVHHDQTNVATDIQIARAAAYSQGYGRLLRVHNYGARYLGIRVGRAAVRGAICFLRGEKEDARQRYGWASGAVRGFFAADQLPEPQR
jgi:GT2 family glycosyltransferase